MPLDLDVIRQSEASALGNVVNNSEFSGDITGSRNAGITVVGLQGNTLEAGSLTVEQAYVWDTTDSELKRERVVLFNKELPVVGTIRGSWDSGLNLFSVYGALIEPTGQAFLNEGEALVFDSGSDSLVVKQLNASRKSYVTASESPFDAENNDIIVCNSTAGAITIEPPATPGNGDSFTVYHTKTSATPNSVTINAATPIVLTNVSAVVVIFDDGDWVAQNIGSPSP